MTGVPDRADGKKREIASPYFLVEKGSLPSVPFQEVVIPEERSGVDLVLAVFDIAIEAVFSQFLDIGAQ